MQILTGVHCYGHWTLDTTAIVLHILSTVKDIRYLSFLGNPSNICAVHLITGQPFSSLYPVSVESALSSNILRIYPKQHKEGALTVVTSTGQMFSVPLRVAKR